MRRCSVLLLSVLCFVASERRGAGQSPAAKQPSPSLRVYSRLVLLDVTVTDAKGAPVHGLARSDFQVLDNNRPQQISSFEEHASDLKVSNASAPAEKGVYSNDFLVHPPPVVNIILIDTNTIDIADQMYLYDQLKRFIAALPADEPVAIYHRWGEYTHLLQSFTADHELLQTALRKAIPRLRATGYATFSDLITLKQMLAFIGRIPGRKNVLWFTGGSNLYLLPDPTLAEAEYQTALQDVYDQLEQARVSLYPIDARGLFYYGASMNTLLQQALMDSMAIATGGHAYFNNNGLTQIASRIVLDDGSYYTLAYSPGDLRLDNHWHKLNVKVNKRACKLSYRRGYFDDAVNSPPPSSANGFRNVLRMDGSTERLPDNRSEPIVFQAKVLPAADMPPPVVGQLPNPPKSPPKKNETAYTIHYTVPLDAFNQQTSDQKQKIQVGAAWLAFDQYGGRAGSLIETFNLSFDPESAGDRGEVAFDQPANLPRGDDYLYLVIWDPATRRVGSMEVPISVPKSTR